MGLTRAEQDAILMPVVLASGHVDRRVCSHGNWMSYPTVNTRLHELRESLRLDDPVLDDIIARAGKMGEKLVWSDHDNTDRRFRRVTSASRW